jgi:hypothetical protein
MEMEKYEVQVLLRHYWKQDYKAVQQQKKYVMLKVNMLWMNVQRKGSLNGLWVSIEV